MTRTSHRTEPDPRDLFNKPDCFGIKSSWCYYCYMDVSAAALDFYSSGSKYMTEVDFYYNYNIIIYKI